MKKRTPVSLIFAFGLTVVSFELAYRWFLLANRGIAQDAIKDMLAFYSHARLAWITLGWYFVSGLLAWLVLIGMKRGKLGWITATTIVAVLIAPGVFVDAPNVDVLLSAVDFEGVSFVVPTWITILNYSLDSPYGWYFWTAVSITFWTVPATWFLLFVLSTLFLFSEGSPQEFKSRSTGRTNLHKNVDDADQPKTPPPVPQHFESPN